VRYRIGDLVSADPDDENFAQEFAGVVGRCNDLLALPNGKTIHSEAFSHAVKESRSIANFQVVQSADGDIALNYVAAAPLEEVELMRIRDRLTRINPQLRNIPIQQVELLEQTIAGKTRRIFRQ
jgi:phenylacetate-coenzyme A ligase PaaK-like adenylate-forming protein